MLVDDPIPERLLHGGVGRVADSGLEGSDKQDSEGVGDGEDVNGGDSLLGTDGADRKRKQCKNLLPEWMRRKTTITRDCLEVYSWASKLGFDCADGGDDPQMRTDAGSGKRPRTAQCKISSLVPTIIKWQDRICGCDVLAIPASTVPSESVFSTGGRVISDYRSSLIPTTVEAICLQDWFKAADDRKNERHDA